MSNDSPYTIKIDATCGQELGSSIKVREEMDNGFSQLRYNFRFRTYAQDGYECEDITTLSDDERNIEVDMRRLPERGNIGKNGQVIKDTVETNPGFAAEELETYDMDIINLSPDEYTCCRDGIDRFMAEHATEQGYEQFDAFLTEQTDSYFEQ